MKPKTIKQYNENGQKHGYCEVYLNDILWYKGYYHNGKRMGYRESNYTNQTVQSKTFYLR